ncbi:precorrin-3B synthase (plasmid) [Gemmobacter aquarius]|uniref:Precorrin-3B synthase n=1 Tax=Paragemmobacter aquarius TaxID=2169400 RepID=A0A2S0USD8_9RHOB|nr:precorrin-3B synthase [Gemmobacter aquarius]AWB50731.1 precorrin-3B synthase [Gemmobacter aquarius]AWB50874.1 precorrin-3B synthase [Gemmobacter aquarius]
MNEFQVQGWCPGALRPMESGDGLVVRVRPPLGRLSQDQARGLAAAARAYGNGLIDLSARGNVQVRGVTAASHSALIVGLRGMDLIDASPEAEQRRNILVTPFADVETLRLASALAGALGQMPPLPGKFGFVVDSGPVPMMGDISGDIRLERAADGRLLIRCDGAALGAPVDDGAAAAVDLARWFVAAGGVSDGRGRMADLIGRGVRPTDALTGTVAPAPKAVLPQPGLVAQGALVGVAFGQMQAEALAGLADLGPLRMTPWRMLLIEGVSVMPALPGLITDPDDPIRRVEACSGAPACLQGRAAVRDLARRLAPQVPTGRLLHVSGCGKGCAHPGRADVTLVATAVGFDLILNGSPTDRAMKRGLDADAIDLGGLF